MNQLRISATAVKHQSTSLSLADERVGAFLLSFSIFSTFLPIKVYPVVFLATTVYVSIVQRLVLRATWVFWLWLYVAYALFLEWLLSLGLQPLSSHTPLGPEGLMNLTKMITNFIFLTAAVSWSGKTSGRIGLRYLDRTLHLIFFLTFLQLFVYLRHAGFGMIGGANTSHAAAEMYDPSLCFWGMADKNVFGARIAVFGFVYILNYFVRVGKVPVWRTVVVMLCALLSNSRTPMAALFIGLVYVLFRALHLRGRIALGAVVAAITPFLLFRLLRLDSMLDTSDGMGVRIVYWSTFFSRFTHLSLFGSGFMSAGTFLGRYSPFYMGEPHLHNLFLNNYLDFGIFGCVFYLLFLTSFYRYCKASFPVRFEWYWTAAFLPLVSIMLILSTGYESDTVVYLTAVVLIGKASSSSRRVGDRKTSRLHLAVKQVRRYCATINGEDALR